MMYKMKLPHGYWYVATPYSKYEKGTEAAFEDACIWTAWLIKNGIKPFSPIVHSHALSQVTGLDPMDHDLWMMIDKPLMLGAEGLIVVGMDGWNRSVGVGMEIDFFKQWGRPIFFLNTKTSDFQELPNG